jgi:hypothetical protein
LRRRVSGAAAIMQTLPGGLAAVPALDAGQVHDLSGARRILSGMRKHPARKARPLLAASFVALLAMACAEDGLSPAELNEAAKERVRQALELTPDSALFSTTFVGRSGDEPILCGRVEGRRADGTRIDPRRFMAATDPARWVRFDLPQQEGHSEYQFEKDWAHLCAGAQTA